MRKALLLDFHNFLYFQANQTLSWSRNQLIHCLCFIRPCISFFWSLCYTPCTTSDNLHIYREALFGGIGAQKNEKPNKPNLGSMIYVNLLHHLHLNHLEFPTCCQVFPVPDFWCEYLRLPAECQQALPWCFHAPRALQKGLVVALRNCAQPELVNGPQSENRNMVRTKMQFTHIWVTNIFANHLNFQFLALKRCAEALFVASCFFLIGPCIKFIQRENPNSELIGSGLISHYCKLKMKIEIGLVSVDCSTCGAVGDSSQRNLRLVA